MKLDDVSHPAKELASGMLNNSEGGGTELAKHSQFGAILFTVLLITLSKNVAQMVW